MRKTGSSIPFRRSKFPRTVVGINAPIPMAVSFALPVIGTFSPPTHSETCKAEEKYQTGAIVRRGKCENIFNNIKKDAHY